MNPVITGAGCDEKHRAAKLHTISLPSCRRNPEICPQCAPARRNDVLPHKQKGTRGRGRKWRKAESRKSPCGPIIRRFLNRSLPNRTEFCFDGFLWSSVFACWAKGGRKQNGRFPFILSRLPAGCLGIQYRQYFFLEDHL